jgi:hypothetical protein
LLLIKPINHGINAANPGQGFENFRIELVATEGTRQVSVIPEQQPRRKDKFKGIFSENTVVQNQIECHAPGPENSSAIQTLNNLSERKNITRSESETSSVNLKIPDPPKSKKKTKSKSKKKEKKAARNLTDGILEAESKGIEVEPPFLTSSSVASPSIPTKPEFDFRGGFQPCKQNITSQNCVVSSTSLSRSEESVQVQPRIHPNATTQQKFRPMGPFQPVPRPVSHPFPQPHGNRHRATQPNQPRQMVNPVQRMPQPLLMYGPFGQPLADVKYQQQNALLQDPRGVGRDPHFNGNNHMNPLLPPHVLPKYHELFFGLLRNNVAKMKISPSALCFSKLKLNEQLDEFVSAMSLNERDTKKRMMLIKSLETIFRVRFPACTIYPFG